MEQAICLETYQKPLEIWGSMMNRCENQWHLVSVLLIIDDQDHANDDNEDGDDKLWQ